MFTLNLARPGIWGDSAQSRVMPKGNLARSTAVPMSFGLDNFAAASEKSRQKLSLYFFVAGKLME